VHRRSVDDLRGGHVILAIDHNSVEFLARACNNIARHQGGKHQS
jgi:hypothetical protein